MNNKLLTIGFLSLLFVTGCGGNSSSNSNTSSPEPDNTSIEEAKLQGQEVQRQFNECLEIEDINQQGACLSRVEQEYIDSQLR